MKKTLKFGLVVGLTFLMTGCGNEFEPTESMIHITSKGEVQSAVVESFDEPYYDFEELSDDVNDAVKGYCLDKNEESITVESLTEEDDTVSLIMNYQSVEDYADFNEVLLFAGTFAEAIDTGYQPDSLYDAEGVSVDLDIEQMENLKVIVTEESICVQTNSKIRYVSDNVTVLDKKLAKAMEAGKKYPAFILYK